MVSAYDDAGLATHGLGGFCMAAEANMPIQERVVELWHELHAREGRFGVDRDAFVGHVMATVDERSREDGVTPEAALDKLVLGDVYLTLGCLDGNPRAIRRFIECFGAYLHKLAHQFAPSKAIAEEVEQELLATLFTGREAGRNARLSSYRGLGTLQGWLRVTSRRVVLDMVRSPGFRDTANPEDDRGAEQLPSMEEAVEDTLEEEDAVFRLRPLLHACMDALPPEDRRLLQRYHRDAYVLREIACELHINISSVHRRLKAARDRIWADLQRRASDELGLDRQDLLDLVSALAEGIDLDDLFSVAPIASIAVIVNVLLVVLGTYAPEVLS